MLDVHTIWHHTIHVCINACIVHVPAMVPGPEVSMWRTKEMEALMRYSLNATINTYVVVISFKGDSDGTVQNKGSWNAAHQLCSCNGLKRVSFMRLS